MTFIVSHLTISIAFFHFLLSFSKEMHVDATMMAIERVKTVRFKEEPEIHVVERYLDMVDVEGLVDVTVMEEYRCPPAPRKPRKRVKSVRFAKKLVTMHVIESFPIDDEEPLCLQCPPAPRKLEKRKDDCVGDDTSLLELVRDLIPIEDVDMVDVEGVVEMVDWVRQYLTTHWY